mgnify:CR=1 FL=1
MDAQNFEQQSGGGREQAPQQEVRVNAQRKSGWGFSPYFILILVVLGGTYFAYVNYFMKGATAPTSSFFVEKFYAVFLDNGDVYFGKLSEKDSPFVTLDNAFYLRVTQTDAQGNPITAPQLNLVKLGNEVHKPLGTIEIQRNHIVSVQELAPDSQVIKIIKEQQ